MNYSLAWDKAYFEPLIIIGLSLFGLLGYWLTTHSPKLEASFKRHFGEDRTKVEWIMFWRYAGLVYFGIIPAIVLMILLPHNAAFYGLSFINFPQSLLWTAIFGTVLVLMQSKNARKPVNTRQYPQIRIQNWDLSLILKNYWGWFIYLLAYEFMYRGFLLFGLIDSFGVWPAIMVNTIIYSLAHIPKGNREALLAIPFGLILCYLTVRTETIWLSVMVHIVLAYSNDYFAIDASETMEFVKKG